MTFNPKWSKEEKETHQEISSTIKADFIQVIPLENEWCHFKRENKILANQISYDAVNLQASNVFFCHRCWYNQLSSSSLWRWLLSIEQKEWINEIQTHSDSIAEILLKKKEGKFAWENRIERVLREMNANNAIKRYSITWWFFLSPSLLRCCCALVYSFRIDCGERKGFQMDIDRTSCCDE